MWSKKRIIRNVIILILFLFFTFLIDSYIMRSSFRIPPPAEMKPQKGPVELMLYPFDSYPDFKREKLTDDGFTCSHPIGLGSYNRILSIKVEKRGINSLEIRGLNSFADGERSEKEWALLSKDNDKYIPSAIINEPFVQLRYRSSRMQEQAGVRVVIRIEDDDPPGNLNIFSDYGSDAYTEKALIRILLDDSFAVYRNINSSIAADRNVIGIVDLSAHPLEKIEAMIERYHSLVKIWNIINISAAGRNVIEHTVSKIFNSSGDMIILWENKGPINITESGEIVFTGNDPEVKLDRGILWTATILFTLMFLVRGTRRIFGIPFLFHLSELISEWYVWLATSLIYLLPLLSEEIHPPRGVLLIRILILAVAIAFISEFLRSLLVKIFGDFFARQGHRGETYLKSWLTVIIAAILIAGLFAGYPGFSKEGTILLVVSNLLCGLFYGRFLYKGKSLGLVFIIHLLALIPQSILLGI